jgi:hypothetical protein
MHKSFLISEQEKNRILKKHTQASKSLYLGILKEQETQLSKDEAKEFLETMKEEIIKIFKSIDTKNKDMVKRDYENKIKEIEDYTKNLTQTVVDNGKVDKLSELIEKINNLYRDTIKEGTEEEKELLIKDYTLSWASFVSTLIGTISNINLKDKINSARIAY